MSFDCSDDGGWPIVRGDAELMLAARPAAGRQVSPGLFSETTGDAKLLCKRFHYGHLVDVNNDGGASSMLGGASGGPNTDSTGYDFGVRHSF